MKILSKGKALALYGFKLLNFILKSFYVDGTLGAR